MTNNSHPKILQINVTANSGSTGRIAEDIGQLVLKEGWGSYIAYSRREVKSKLKTIKIGNKFDFYSHGLITRIFDKHGLGSYVATKKLIRKIKEISPAIIHLHNIHGYYINYKLLFDFLAKSQIPVVWTLHDCWSFTGHCAYFDFIGCNKWQTACSKCPQKKEYPKSLLFDRSSENYDDKRRSFTLPPKMVLVPVSYWLDGLLHASFLKDYPRRVIQNGINLEVFRNTKSDFREKYGLQGKTIVLGVASIWDRRKGLDDFIALSRLIKEDTVIVLIGLSEKQIQNLPINILGIGRTESTVELAKIYSAVDVFFNPTWEDNYPTTNLEAIACGTPVITYKTGGSIESISEKNGFIVEKGDLLEVQDKINIIKNNKEDDYQKECENYALEHFNKDYALNNYISLYKEMLKL